jgi:hypothetical protein
MLTVGLAGSGHGPVISLLLLGALILGFALFCWVCYMLRSPIDGWPTRRRG